MTDPCHNSIWWDWILGGLILVDSLNFRCLIAHPEQTFRKYVRVFFQLTEIQPYVLVCSYYYGLQQKIKMRCNICGWNMLFRVEKMHYETQALVRIPTHYNFLDTTNQFSLGNYLHSDEKFTNIGMKKCFCCWE